MKREKSPVIAYKLGVSLVQASTFSDVQDHNNLAAKAFKLGKILDDRHEDRALGMALQLKYDIQEQLRYQSNLAVSYSLAKRLVSLI